MAITVSSVDALLETIDCYQKLEAAYRLYADGENDARAKTLLSLMTAARGAMDAAVDAVTQEK
jgi:hypothetical protein